MTPLHRTVALLAALAATAACSSTATPPPANGYSDASPRSGSAEARQSSRRAADRLPVFPDRALQCAYTDLGEVEGRTLNLMKREASRRGADAVIDARSERARNVGLARVMHYSGRAIRFDDPECRS
jgi:hypothetical protein